MVTTNVEDIYPLSPMQQGMLLHTLQDSSGDMYLQQDVYIVDGHLDTDLLIEAWQQVFAAHPALRTSFQWDGLDQPLQVVHRSVTPPTRLDDWRGQPEEEQQRRLEELLSKDRASGFDLTVPPLQRLLVVRLDDERHALAWTHHHLLMDGWSVPLFMNEVMSQYRRLTTGGPGPAPAPPFRDYIAWLDRQDMDAARKFWSDSLGDVRRRPLRGLRPVDPQRPPGEPRRRVVDIADTIEDGLRATAARHRVTATTVLDAAWAAVLHRHADSAGSEVVLGLVSSGRSAELPGADRMIGVLINTLPVAVAVPEDAELGEWLREVHLREATARQYEYSPLAEIKKWVGAPGRQLFDSIVVYANYDFGVVDDGPLIVRSQNTFDKISVPLAVVLTPKPVSQLQLIWHEDRFEETAVDALLAGLLAALDEIGTAERTSSILSAVAATVPAATAEVPAPSASAGAVSPAKSPVTPVESAIAAAWCDVLGIAEVDVTANFFDLGGDSFSAVRAVSRIEGATVALLALNPTVRDLAIAIGSLEPEDQELDADLERQLAEKQAPKEHPARPGQLEPGSLVSSSRRGSVQVEQQPDRHIPLMASQEFLWLISWSTPPQTNRLEIWELPSNVTSADITNALYELLVRHEALRTTFGLTSEGIPHQRIATARLHGIPEYDLSRDPQRALEVMAEMRDSVIQPHGSRLYRVAIFMDGEARWIALALSHLVADGESMNILRRDLFRSLQGQVLAEVRRQPAEQALMESSARYRPTLERAISCFEEAVQHAPSRLFPLLRNEVPPDSCLRARLRSTAVDSAVRALATQLSVTPPVIYSTVFVASLATLSRNPRYTIFVNFHGRFDAALKDSVGCYFTRGLIGGPADDAVSFLGLMKSVREETLKVMPLSTYSYCEAEEARIRIERARGRSVRLASTFDYAEAPGAGFLSADLTTGDEISVERTDHPIPNNDLSLMVRAGGGEAELDLLGSSAALNADELTSVLRAMKQVIVTLSEDPAARGAAIAGLLRQHGLPVLDHGPDFVYSDASWVNLGATRELILSFEGVQDACVAAREGEEEPILVAHVAAKSQALRAWQLRQHMLDQFHTQPGAAVPHRFTIVDAPPAGEKNVDAWERQTVIEDGDGTNLPRRQPASLTEDVLCSAIQRFHPDIEVDVNTDYVSMGGRALLAPAVSHAVEGCGYVGVTALDLVQPRSIAALACRLRPRRLPPQL